MATADRCVIPTCTPSPLTALPRALFLQLPSLEEVHFAPGFRKAAFSPFLQGSAATAATPLGVQRRRARDLARDLRDSQASQAFALGEAEAEEETGGGEVDEGGEGGRGGGTGQEERRVFGAGGSLYVNVTSQDRSAVRFLCLCVSV